MHKLTRRSALTTMAAAAAMPSLGAAGANDKINLGFIGLGGRGMGSVNWFKKEPDVNIVAISDVDQNTLDRAKKACPDAMATTDLRKLIENKDVDAVVVSTCNHWHVLASLWAIQAGKDVYVEKPISHNIWEGRKLVEAARKYKRIVQGGTQQRSDHLQDQLKDFFDTGALGAIKEVRCNRYGVRASIGKRDTPLTPPESVDYDLWLGPAADVPIMREKFHYDWHWNWNTGNGELGNWGPHILDDLRNVVFRDKIAMPKKVLAGGGRYGWNDAGESPNTHFVYMDTGDVPVIVDVHNLPIKKGVKGSDVYQKRRSRGFLIVECENGYYAGGRGGGTAYDADGKSIKKFKGDGGGEHARNFLDAIKSRDQESLKGEIEKIHYSSSWCHLGNISYQLGQSGNANDMKDMIAGYKPWGEVIDQFNAHLEANEVDPAKAGCTIGTLLEIDGESFTGPTATPEALAMLRREYRKGFEVPENV